MKKVVLEKMRVLYGLGACARHSDKAEATVKLLSGLTDTQIDIVCHDVVKARNSAVALDELLNRGTMYKGGGYYNA